MDEFYVGRWDQANIPIKMRGRDFRHYEPATGTTGKPHKTGEAAFQAARDFVDHFSEHYVSPERAKAGKFPNNRDNIGKGLLFFGHNGTRKSTLAAAILTEVQYRNIGYSGLYIRFSEWQRALQDTYDKELTERKVRALQLIDWAENRPLLVLDDIGQEYSTASGYTKTKFHELVRVRAEAARPTILTSNIDLHAMRGIYGDSFESFRHEAFDAYPMIGKDTRL